MRLAADVYQRQDHLRRPERAENRRVEAPDTGEKHRAADTFSKRQSLLRSGADRFFQQDGQDKRYDNRRNTDSPGVAAAA